MRQWRKIARVKNSRTDTFLNIAIFMVKVMAAKKLNATTIKK